MQSPAWNDDFDPTVGERDPWYDWDLIYPSDFFNEDVPEKKRKRRSGRDEPKTETNSKRSKLEATDTTPEPSPGEPAAASPKVVWKSDRHLPSSIPVVNHGEAEKVALLKDWRDRYKGPAFGTLPQIPQRPSKPGFAVVIEQRDSYSRDGSRGGSKGRRESKSKINRASDTNTQQFTNGSSAVDSIPQKTAPPTSIPRKRKKAPSDVDGELEEEGAEEWPVVDPQNQPPSDPNTNPPANTQAPGRKRKAIDQDPTPPAAKRKAAPAPKPANASKPPSSASTDPLNRPTRKSARKK